MIHRGSIKSQLKGNRKPGNKIEDKPFSRFNSTGRDPSDLEIIRGAKNIDDGPAKMSYGGMTNSANKAGSRIKKYRKK